MIRKLVLASVLLLTTSLALAQDAAGRAEARATARGRDAAAPIVGLWLTTITPDVAGAPPFIGLSTFNADGTFLETNSSEGPTFESPGHGLWLQVNATDYLLNITNLEYDGKNNFVGYDKVRVKFTMSDDRATISGPFQLDVLTPDGVKVFGATGKVSAKRMAIEALQ